MIHINRKGVIMVTVLILIAIMAIITISIISMNSSQAINVENEVKRVQAEALGVGIFQAMLVSPSYTPAASATISGNKFTIGSSYNTASNSGPLGTDPVTITIQY